MAVESQFRADDEPPERYHDTRRRPMRLQLTPAERRALPIEVLALIGPLFNRDPSTWTLDEVQAVTAALESANGNGEAAAVRSRVLAATRVVQDHEVDFRYTIEELRAINEELVAARRRPNSTTSTISRHMARLHVDKEKREAGVKAREKVREAWRTNPGDPRARIEMTTAQADAEREVELLRTHKEAKYAAEDEAERVKRHNAKSTELHDRKAAAIKTLRDANVPVPPEPAELSS